MSNVFKRLLGRIAAGAASVVSAVFAGKAVSAALPAGILFLSSGACGIIAVAVVYLAVNSALEYLLALLWPYSEDERDEFVSNVLKSLGLNNDKVA